jgi:hypothetical protein
MNGEDLGIEAGSKSVGRPNEWLARFGQAITERGQECVRSRWRREQRHVRLGIGI